MKNKIINIMNIIVYNGYKGLVSVYIKRQY